MSLFVSGPKPWNIFESDPNTPVEVRKAQIDGFINRFKKLLKNDDILISYTINKNGSYAIIVNNIKGEMNTDMKNLIKETSGLVFTAGNSFSAKVKEVKNDTILIKVSTLKLPGS